MQRQLDDLGTRLALVSAAACGVVFAIGLLRRLPPLDLLRSSVSLGVAAVPEGLPAVATTTLALGIRRMRRHHASVRRLGAVEALGAVQVLCLDKTGTLTRNRMAVCALHLDGQRLAVDEEARANADDVPTEQLEQFLRAVALCNESEFALDELGRSVTQGSATENALLDLARGSGLDVSATRARYPLLATHYRAEGRPFMVTEHRLPGGRRLVVIKGAPRAVVERCRKLRRGRRARAFTATDAGEILRENERWASEGLRVLGVATAVIGKNTKTSDAPWEWLGLVGLSDPLRPGVGELIADLHAAGIRTVMITGDQSATAYAIASELGLSAGRPLNILDSTNLAGVDGQALKGLVQEVDVFARVSPSHKLEIVQALQRAGRVVAMTGDGINDGPALKAADVGIAMGSAQLDVARSVADIVIEDDNLATLVRAIAEGRTTYGNIRKALRFLLSTNFGEIGMVLASLLLGLKPPFSAMQLLWINLVTDIFPGLALAREPAEDGVLERPPRDPRTPIVSDDDLAVMIRESVVMTGGTLGAYLYGLLRHGPGSRASTLALSSLIGGQMAHALTCRSEDASLMDLERLAPNRTLDLALGGTIAVQTLATLLPPLRRLLGLAPLGPLDLLVAGLASAIPALINDRIGTASRTATDRENTAAPPADEQRPGAAAGRTP
jgi:Ca2+-transporting ATPase